MATEGRSVLITGCSPGGIGHALAREFHFKGLRVFATARRVETISDLAAIGIETLSLEVDKADSVTKVKQEIQQLTGGRLHFLVNNAGRVLLPWLRSCPTDISRPQLYGTCSRCRL